ncbi:hypothetical protein TNCV_1811681 [Trichonephila clavipes]|nr:hypothetical protein TNCV_1811681 [Trichonephila clavipes]
MKEKWFHMFHRMAPNLALKYTQEDVLEFVQSSKSVIDANSCVEDKRNHAASVPTSSEMRNIMKSMRSYLDVHSNGEMNNKMDDIEQSAGNIGLNKYHAKESIRLFSKKSKNILFLKKN